MVPSFPSNCALFYKACPIIRSLSSKRNTLAAILMLRHFKDEVPLSQELIRARHSSNLPHDDNYKNNSSLQVLTLPLIQNAVSTPAFQRVQTASDAPVRPSPSLLTPSDQPSSHQISVQTLLNPEHFGSPSKPAFMTSTSHGTTPSMPTAFMPSRSLTVSSGIIDAEQSRYMLPQDHANASSTPSSLSLSKTITGSLFSLSPYASALPLTRSSARRQAHNCDHPEDVNPAPPQPASRNDNLCGQYSSYSQVSRTEPSIALPVAFISQAQPFSSDPASKAFSEKALEIPTSTTTAQIQYQTGTKQRKCKRDFAATSYQYRQRQKAKEQWSSEEIARLELQVRETAEEKDYYLRQMNHLQDVIFAIVHSLQHSRHRQDAEDTLRWVEHNLRNINCVYVPPQDSSLSTVKPSSPMAASEGIDAMPSEFIQAG